ncbi:MAG: hypothetical protein Q9161_007458 [Pseudevernia consocians]
MTQVLSPIDRGSWNKSAFFSNNTGPGIVPVSIPSLNVTGQSLWNSSNSSLEQALWPSLETYNNFPDQCLLWDNQCTGNRTEALDLFFNNSGTLYNVVYGAHCIWSREYECAPWLPSPAVLPDFLDWLRKPECVQSFYEYHTHHTDQPPWTWSGRIFDGWSTYTIDWNTVATTTSSVGCCEQCTILGGNVDVYYWPVSGAKEDCVLTIGSEFNNPVTELLITDDRGYPYWKAQTNPWGQNGSLEVDSITLPPQQALAGAPNPLSGQTNIIKAREYWPNNITVPSNFSSSVAIATIGDFRCTSPSVCVGFSDIYAADACGALSTDGELIPYTIVAFAPGELSTIQIPAWVRASVPPQAAIRSFNFADLPCPPQSVMYAVEYKPAPGEPYRPVLSPPHRLSSLLPEWSKSNCIIPAALFNGVDPPRALKPAEVLIPRVTQVLPTASVAAVAAPASGIRANKPSKTPNPSTVGDKEISGPSDTDTHESGSEVSDPSKSDPSNSDPSNSDPSNPDPSSPDPSNSDPSNSDPSNSDPSSPDPSSSDPKTTDPKAVDSEGPNINQPQLNSADAQDTRTSTTDPAITPAQASNIQPPNPENLDPESANLLPSDSQDVHPQVLDGHDKPGDVQSSSPQTSNSDDLNADKSSPDRSPTNVPANPSNVADSSNEDSENLPPNDFTTHLSDSNGKETSSLDSQKAEAGDLSILNPNSFNGKLKVTNSQGKDAAISHPKKMPVADPKADGGDDPDAKDTDDKIDLFDIQPTKLFNEALSPSAKSEDGQHSTPNDPERDSSSQPGTSGSPSFGDNRNDEDASANDVLSLSLQGSVKILTTAGSLAMADLASKAAPADGQTHATKPSTNYLSTAESYPTGGPLGKTAATDDSDSAVFAVGISKQSGSAVHSTIQAAGVSTNSGSALSSASEPAPGLGLGGDGTSDSKSEGKNINSAASSKAKSSGSSLLASRTHSENRSLIGVRELLYGFCIYVLPWLLILS